MKAHMGHMKVPTLTGFVITGLFQISHPKSQQLIISINCYLKAETGAVNKTKLHLMGKNLWKILRS